MLLDTSCYAFYAAIIFGAVHDVFDGHEDRPTTSNLTPEKFSAMMRVLRLTRLEANVDS